ncbi:MAG: MmcQ/YjbR family DNA-binding protein [Mycobacteriales bacterium]
MRLPETEFDPGRPVFPTGVVRVRGKVIAYPAGGDRGSPPDAKPGEEFVFIEAPPAEREALLHEDPVRFFVTAHYAGAPGVIVRLSTVDADQLAELLVDAWRTVAPKRLVKAYDQSRSEMTTVRPKSQ